MPTIRRLFALPFVLVLGLTLARCGGDGTGPPDQVPTTVQIANANLQLNAIGATATLAVTVLDQSGQPITNPPLSFTSLNESVATVGGTGLVTAIAEGSTEIRVEAGDAFANADVTVEQTGAAVVAVSGDGQTGQVGTQLPNPLVVRIDDSEGNPVEGEDVSFQVTAGGGTVSAATVTSDASGEASVTWTLGDQTGQQSVQASVGGASFTFTATAEAGPPAAFTVTGDGQSGVAGFALLESLSILVKDASGNVVSGATVNLSASDGGSVTPASFTSGETATLVDWTLGGAGGEQTLSVTAGGIDTGVTATAVSPTMIAPGTAATNQSGDAGEAVYYTFETPAAAPEGTDGTDGITFDVTQTVLTVSVSGGSGDRDLHVRHGAPPEGGEDGVTADCSDAGPGTDKICEITSPQDGSWFAAVIGASGFSDATVLASLETLQPDLVAGPLTVTPAAPNETETVTIEGSITNDGTLASGTFGWSIRVDGIEVASGTVDDLPPGETATMSAENVGPFAIGQHTATLVADPEDTVEDANPADNTSEAAFTVTEVGNQPPEAVINAAPSSVPEGDGNETVVMLFGGNSTDPDGDLLTFSWTAENGTFEGGVDTGEKVNVTFPGTASRQVTLTVDDGQGEQNQAQTTIQLGPALNPAGTFNIELVFVDNADTQEPTAAQTTAFNQAEAQWEEIVRSELSDINFTGAMIDIEESCTDTDPDGDGMPGDGDVDLNDNVDDLRIYVFLEPIDGPQGALGSAGPCFIRNPPPTGLPVVGSMRFDTDDLEKLETDGILNAVILHEMAHVLGMGTLWRDPADECLNFGFDFLIDPSLSFDEMCELQNVDPPPDTRYDGAAGVAAWRSMGGGNTALVPIENGDGPNEGGPGNRDGHWREVTFTNELMTAFIAAGEGSNPLSKLTIAGLEDLTYIVNYAPADPFTLPDPIVTAPPLLDPGALLLDDLRRGPIWVVDENGRIVGRGGNE